MRRLRGARVASLCAVTLCAVVLAAITVLRRAGLVAPAIEFTSLYQGVRRAASSTSSCAPAFPHVLVYTRIEKTGSQSLVALIELLAAANNFSVTWPFARESDWAAALQRGLENPRPSILLWPYRFPGDVPAMAADTGLHRQHDGRVAHFSVVREPTARCVSGYYYYRDNEPRVRAENPARKLGPCFSTYGDSANDTLDACLAPVLVAEGAPLPLPRCFVSSCDAAQQACYFAPPRVGCARWCALEGAPATHSNEEVLRAAQRSALLNYAVVGVTEALADTVDVLERVFPRFFAGGGAAFRTIGEERSHLNSHVGRPLWRDPAPATRHALARIVAPDAAFYNDARARFAALHAACAVPSPTPRPRPSDGCEPSTFLHAWDIPASELRNVRAEQPRACCAECVRDAVCAAWVWRGGACWMKASARSLRLVGGLVGEPPLVAGYVRDVV